MTTKLTIELDPQLHSDFIEAVELSNSDVSDVLGKFMQKFIDSEQKKSYVAYAHRKVEGARSEIRLGQGISNKEINAKFAKKRADAIKNLS